MNSQDDDRELTLAQLSRRHDKSLVDLLLDISKHQVEQGKFFEFLWNLTCLVRPPQRKSSIGAIQVRRKEIDAFSEKYTAVSYTWDPSKIEGKTPKSGGYEVEIEARRGQRQFRPSEVRDSVFERAFKYMHADGQKLLWIDRECIEQQQHCNKVNCGHQTCQHKQEAIQTMDLVYKRCQNSVALLSTPIQSVSDLDLLSKILKREIDPQSEPEAAHSALALLNKITNDHWWTRAWTFQEQYCAGISMTLLIPHHPDLENIKRSHHIFHKVEGELCINLVNFSTKATKLCQALRKIRPKTQGEKDAIDNILGKAGKYTHILGYSEPMFPRIISDIEKRNSKNPWDRLAITANCCQYPMRLDVNTLRQDGMSLSLSTLAMCVLNGEVFKNSKELGPTETRVPNMTVSQYLEKRFFCNVAAPKVRYALSFKKGCRFPTADVNEKGVTAFGHLWRLGKTIDTREFYKTSSNKDRLFQLADKLEVDNKELARFLSDYLKRDYDHPYETFSKRYMGKMARTVASAIHQEKQLILGSLWKKSNKYSPYRAIFILDGASEPNAKNQRFIRSPDAKRHRKQRRKPRYAFTAIGPRSDQQLSGSSREFPHDIDCHVSLEVDFPQPDIRISNPKLYTRGWLLGLCFFGGCPMREVTFPWPSSLMAIDESQGGSM